MWRAPAICRHGSVRDPDARSVVGSGLGHPKGGSAEEESGAALKAARRCWKGRRRLLPRPWGVVPPDRGRGGIVRRLARAHRWVIARVLSAVSMVRTKVDRRVRSRG
jgi:hypothetical protein